MYDFNFLKINNEIQQVLELELDCFCKFRENKAVFNVIIAGYSMLEVAKAYNLEVDLISRDKKSHTGVEATVTLLQKTTRYHSGETTLQFETTNGKAYGCNVNMVK